uniref:CPBP family intramembrane metalloprotease n=1 Tax=Heterorhabditis bacteriophora TaxID=37862 RepID=A0A1I7WCG6_HETBA
MKESLYSSFCHIVFTTFYLNLG